MIKTVVTTIFTFILSLTVNSQITERNWMVGGSGSFTHRTIDTGVGNSKNSVLIIRPNIGYFLKDKFVVGSSLSYYRYQDLEFDSYVMNYGMGLFTRYYFLKPEKTFNIFTQVHFDKVFYKNNAGGENKGNGHNYGAKVGQVIFFNNSVGLEFSIDYEKTITGEDFTEDFIIGIGFQIHLEK